MEHEKSNTEETNNINLGTVFSQDEENELQRLVRKIHYRCPTPTIEDMKKADELTRKKWKLQGVNISDVSSRTYRIKKARDIYEIIFSLYDEIDKAGDDDLNDALTSITRYILKMEQC
jgi:hypothetical protein